MVKITTPVRIDISAGWSDADPFRKDYESYVLNGAINLRVRAELAGKKLVTSLEKIPKNSGLGTSAALRACYILASNPRLIKDKLKLIREVWIFENKVLNQNAGLQDQAAAIYGGVNLWKFGKGDGGIAKIERTSISKKKTKHLEERLVLIFTGGRQSSDIHNKVFSRYKKNIKNMKKMSKIAKKMAGVIDEEKKMSELIRESWKLQKRLHPSIESVKMKELQKRLRGKYLACRATGAGGGGCMLFYTSDKTELIKEARKLERKLGIKIIDFKFDYEGVGISF